MSQLLRVCAVWGSPGKQEGPRALSGVAGVWEAPTLAPPFPPEASMKVGVCISPFPQTKKA